MFYKDFYFFIFYAQFNDKFNTWRSLNKTCTQYDTFRYSNKILVAPIHHLRSRMIMGESVTCYEMLLDCCDQRLNPSTFTHSK